MRWTVQQKTAAVALLLGSCGVTGEVTLIAHAQVRTYTPAPHTCPFIRSNYKCR